MVDDVYAQVFFVNTETPTGFGLVRDGCDVFATTPCCDAMIYWGRSDVDRCYKCKKEIVPPPHCVETNYSICLAFDGYSPSAIREWAAQWSGYSEDAMDVETKSTS